MGVSVRSCVASHSACLLLRPRGETPVCSDHRPGPLLYHPDGERGGTLPPGEGEPAARPPANQSCLARPPIWESEPRGGGGGKERESTAHLPPSQLCLPSPPVQSGPEMLPLGCCVGRGASSAFFLGPPVSMRGLELGSWLGRLSKMEGLRVIGRGSCSPCLFTLLTSRARAQGWVWRGSWGPL